MIVSSTELGLKYVDDVQADQSIKISLHYSTIAQ